MTYLLISIASAHVLWLHFVACMRLKMVRDAGLLTTPMKVFGYPVLAMGLVIDFFVNICVGTVLFLELPREYTLSARLWRLSNDAPSWRQRIALAIRTGLLDNVDPAGKHTG